MRFLHIVHRRDSPPTFSAFGLNLTCGNYCLEHATFCSFLSTSNCHLECARSWECSLVLFASRARQDQPSLVFLKATSPPLHLDGERGGGGGGKQTATRRLGGNFWRPTSPYPPPPPHRFSVDCFSPQSDFLVEPRARPVILI